MTISKKNYALSVNQTGNQSSNQNGNQTGNPIIKTKNKTKNNNNSGELFPPEEKPKKKKTAKAEFIPPTLGQVKAYFEEKLPDWERQAEIFFYHFDSLGWRNANGAKIERWDSKANLWIMDEQAKQYQHGKQSENSCGGNKPSDNGTTAGKLKAVEL